MASKSGAAKIVAPYRGKTWKMAPSAAEIFAHEPAALPVRFFDAAELAAHLAEVYQDYLQADDFPCIDDDGEWTNEDVVPIAAVGYLKASKKKGAAFLEESFAYLFFDEERERVIYATSDEWTFDNTLDDLDALELEPV